jgi:transposase
MSVELEKIIRELPSETQKCVKQEVEHLNKLQGQITCLEERIRERIPINQRMWLLKTLPGVGDILSIVIACEIGSVERFTCAEGLASYAGVVPGVKSSGDTTRYGHLPKQANHYLKWAYIEAANSVSSHHNFPNWRQKHVTLL